MARARIEKLTGQTKLLLQSIHAGGAHPGDAQHKTAKKWDKKVRKEIGTRHKASKKIQIAAYNRRQEADFNDHIGVWMKGIIGTSRHAGPGGAVAPRDDEGRRLNEEEEHARVESDYTDWCTGRQMEAPTHLPWYEEVLGEQAWARGAIYAPLMVTITEEEVNTSLKASGSTAPGPSGLTTEAWRQAGVAKELTAAFNDIITRREWPEGMVDGLIYPIAKKIGPCTADNARPIALLETVLKVLTRIRGTRWNKVLQNHPVLERNQMAFVPGVDIMENIEVDSFLWEWCRAHQEREDGSGHLHAAYLDCSKAYDSVPP